MREDLLPSLLLSFPPCLVLIILFAAELLLLWPLMKYRGSKWPLDPAKVGKRQGSEGTTPNDPLSNSSCVADAVRDDGRRSGGNHLVCSPDLLGSFVSSSSDGKQYGEWGLFIAEKVEERCGERLSALGKRDRQKVLCQASMKFSCSQIPNFHIVPRN